MDPVTAGIIAAAVAAGVAAVGSIAACCIAINRKQKNAASHDEHAEDNDDIGYKQGEEEENEFSMLWGCIQWRGKKTTGEAFKYKKTSNDTDDVDAANEADGYQHAATTTTPPAAPTTNTATRGLAALPNASPAAPNAQTFTASDDALLAAPDSKALAQPPRARDSSNTLEIKLNDGKLTSIVVNDVYHQSVRSSSDPKASTTQAPKTAALESVVVDETTTSGPLPKPSAAAAKAPPKIHAAGQDVELDALPPPANETTHLLADGQHHD